MKVLFCWLSFTSARSANRKILNRIVKMQCTVSDDRLHTVVVNEYEAVGLGNGAYKNCKRLCCFFIFIAGSSTGSSLDYST